MKRKGNALKRKRRLRIFLSLVAVVCLLSMTVIALSAVYVSQTVEQEIDLSVFKNAGKDTVSRLYYFDDDGNAKELEDDRLYGTQVTVYTSLEEIPDALENAFVSIEDKRFFEHSGVDWKRTVAATANYILKYNKSTFGASTITQQLIKNVTGSDEVTVSRKLQEIFYALDLEKSLEKDEILELYLNIVNLSQGCYGVGAASEKYFSKCVEELSLSECATIAAITKNPTYYDPIKNPENNLERRNTILHQMYSQGYITESEYNDAKAKELTLNVSREKGTVNSWYADMVVEDVIDALESELGYTRAMASYLVYNGGLKIYTAMDPDVQKTVSEYYADESNFPKDDLEDGRSGMIIIDPRSGNILGVAGDIGEKSANRIQNYATDTLRPSGSSIKPLSVYAPALEEGVITWSSVYDDIPIEFIEKGSGYATWPKNATNTYYGLSNIAFSVENSLNTVAVKALYDLGVEKSYEYLTEKFNITNLTEKDKVPAALALGQQTYGVTLREITAAYSVFANGGMYSKPRSYIMVMTSNGDVLLNNTEEHERVVSEGNAAIMTKLLETVVDNGSVSYNITLRKQIDVAGKTGTTQDTCDRWFIGYTPYYVCGVWYGHEYPETLPSSTNSICSKTWNAVMSEIHSEYIESGSTKNFEVPENVIEASYCVDSGKLMTGACLCDPRGSREDSGWFIEGTQPKGFCERHVLVDYDIYGEGVANESCNRDGVVKVGLLRIERSFPCEVYVTDAEYVWKELTNNIAHTSNNETAFFSAMLGADEYCGVSDTERQYNSGCKKHKYYH